MSERVYSEHLRWTKDGLRTHEDIYNGRGDSTDWATEAEAHRSRRCDIYGYFLLVAVY